MIPRREGVSIHVFSNPPAAVETAFESRRRAVFLIRVSPSAVRGPASGAAILPRRRNHSFHGRNDCVRAARPVTLQYLGRAANLSELHNRQDGPPAGSRVVGVNLTIARVSISLGVGGVPRRPLRVGVFNCEQVDAARFLTIAGQARPYGPSAAPHLRRRRFSLKG